MKTFYITTPLYYVNDRPHIGHTYTTVAADSLARWQRFCGKKVYFLTGTDEHGSKVEQAAASFKKELPVFIQEMSEEFKSLWDFLGISNDDFIRTSEKRHTDIVQKVFHRLHEKGYIYKGTYSGLYCTPCESFWTDSQLVNGLCPDCGRAVESIAEESYFFKLSQFAQPLLDYYQQHPSFISPAFRQLEITNFINSGLKDLSVSRTRVSWGIPVPFDPQHTIYVWFDALLNYITAPGYLDKPGQFAGIWPADVQLVGKEIFRFHTIIFPAILLALELPLPSKVFAHGWWTVEGEKMSKSRGNVVDPRAVCREFGIDALRYFLLRSVPFGTDGDFSLSLLNKRYNADLANELGNLLSRSLTMIEKYSGGKIPKTPSPPPFTPLINTLAENMETAIRELAFHQALTEIWLVIKEANRYIDTTAPWNLAKQNDPRLPEALYNLGETLRLIALALYPFLPSTAENIWRQLGCPEKLTEQTIDNLNWGQIKPEQKVAKSSSLFPRINKVEIPSPSRGEG
ncbi:MAG: methionine--tRNA ligase [Elusimicrobiota bacterium]